MILRSESENMKTTQPVKVTRTLWPWAIIAAFCLFISGTVSLVVLACSQKVDLVSADYYEQEIRFQKHLDRVKCTEQSGARAAIGYDAPSQSIRISLPGNQI